MNLIRERLSHERVAVCDLLVSIEEPAQVEPQQERVRRVVVRERVAPGEPIPTYRDATALAPFCPLHGSHDHDGDDCAEYLAEMDRCEAEELERRAGRVAFDIHDLPF